MNKELNIGEVTMGLQDLFKQINPEHTQIFADTMSNLFLMMWKGMNQTETATLAATLLAVLKNDEALAELREMSAIEMIDMLKNGFANAK